MIVASRARVNLTVLLPCPASFSSKKLDLPWTRMVVCEVSSAAWERVSAPRSARRLGRVLR